MARPWFRMYRKIVESRKLHDIKPELFKTWVFLLALTDDDGALPSIEDAAFALRLTPQKTAETIDKLVESRLLDRDGDIVTAHDWDDYQRDSDTDTSARDRKRKQRDKDKPVTPDVTDASRVTPPVTNANGHAAGHVEVTRLDKRREDKRRGHASVTPSPKASRWEAGRSVPDEWLAEVPEVRARAKLPPIDAGVEAEKFAEYWPAQHGAKALKADWHFTWRTWIRRADGPPPKSTGMGPA